jgi:hypothetical protein
LANNDKKVFEKLNKWRQNLTKSVKVSPWKNGIKYNKKYV